MRSLSCGRCGLRVFFENTWCERCGALLGFVPDELAFAAFELDAQGAWQRLGSGGAAPQRPCANYADSVNQAQDSKGAESAATVVCNWMIPMQETQSLCRSCRTTQVIPALNKAENRSYWVLLERAKRRLLYSLIALKLPAPSKTDDPAHGLSFHFLEEVQPKVKVLTGHDNGVITLNIAEADDARREQVRMQMHEPYRTLLGHFRHEIGHYYWDRLVRDTPWLAEFRALFGDERADYGQALQAHYAAPKLDWPLSFVSAYASSHPWEDWAECWAHYLHIQDGLDTAAAWGLQLANDVPGMPVLNARGLDPAAADVRADLIEQWLPVSQFVNAMDRSLGSSDSYPFVLTDKVLLKLAFVHQVLVAAGRGEVPALQLWGVATS
ncbi:putative zinc-binding peptidase [Paucibacter sp. B2R-40]|uniref:zinc-binding metallopeptidase family protein n=1 Tax=Paucibacter sp. B2R-40 TaxID=2893554 RepID=UPI0021E47B5F|nr:putative zinc-binding metallopeptidase [Paucibacter sp. B2R-40]MCV2355991.1 putative zinc-binding peptidase [Paucibacter sp. B2R-40]